MADELLLSVLPEVFREVAEPGTPLRALAAVTEEYHAPVRALLDGVETVADPYRAPVALVSSLSSWVDLDWLTMPATDFSSDPIAGVPTERQRDLIANAAELSATRGTAAGMTRFLRLATGVDGFEVAALRAFHLGVTVPSGASDQLELVSRIVAGIKPAHLTHEVSVASPEPTS